MRRRALELSPSWAWNSPFDSDTMAEAIWIARLYQRGMAVVRIFLRKCNSSTRHHRQITRSIFGVPEILALLGAAGGPARVFGFSWIFFGCTCPLVQFSSDSPNSVPIPVLRTAFFFLRTCYDFALSRSGWMAGERSMDRRNPKAARETTNLAWMASEKGGDYPGVWFATLQETKMLVTYSKHTEPLDLVRDTLQGLEFGFCRLVLRRFSTLVLDDPLERWLPDFGARTSPRLFFDYQPFSFPPRHLCSPRPKTSTIRLQAAAL